MSGSDRPITAFDLRSVRIVTGAGSLDSLPVELARKGFERPFLISTPGRTPEVERVRLLLGRMLAGEFLNARVHAPTPVLTAALSQVRATAADSVLSVGGGSAIGVGKLVARETGLPVIAIPTTYSGSEMTATWGETTDATKRTGHDPRVAPVLVIYDAELTLDLPPDLSAASGMNGLAHAVEALYAPDVTPLSTMVARHAIRQFKSYLPRVVEAPTDLAARTGALEAAQFAGMALGMTTMGLHHKLCHVLGGAFDLPHALTHATLLPHVVSYNSSAAPEAMRVIAESLGGHDAAQSILAFRTSLNLHPTLNGLGFPADAIDRIADEVVAARPKNPAPVTRDGVRRILEAASAS